MFLKNQGYLTPVLFSQYPESVMFRDCSDLNFKDYLDIIKEPIALDVIKEKLDRENPEMVKYLIYFDHLTSFYLFIFYFYS